MKKLIKIPQNFKYPKIPATQYHFGSGEVVGNILRPDGDWRNYQTPAEEQRRNGVESSACFIEAQQSTIASIMEEQFDIPDQNFSARFNLIFAESNRNGGDPLKGAQTFRDKGLIPDSFLPFSDDIKSWEEFRSFKGGDKDNCESQGRTWRGVWEAKYDVVFTKKEALEEKYRKLRNALKYSPVPLSVYGVTDGVTYIKKPSGVSDTHMVKALFVDDKNQIYIRDTYAPFDKVLPANYNSDFGMRWTVEKQATKEEVGIFIKMLQAISDFLKSFVASPVVMPVPPVVPPVVPPIMPPIVAPPVPKYEWDTAAKAKHSVRVICDEEGLTVAQKNELCATVGGESGWKNTAKLENKKNGKTWSTDWGICQINDFYHIGAGKSFPSVEYVLANPEKVVRWMCTQWKAGNKNWWIAFKSGIYKKFL